MTSSPMLILRFVALALIFSLFPALVYFELMGKHGIGFVPLIICLLLLSLASKSEALLSALARAKVAPIGVNRTLRILAQGDELPSVFVFKDPVPQFFVGCSLFGRGAIYLSQGLVTQLEEKEFRAVLEQCLLTLASPGIKLESLSLVIGTILMRAAPKAWIETAFRRNSQKFFGGLGVGRALVFLSIFSFARLILRIGTSQARSKISPAPSNETYFSAMRKVDASRAIWNHLSLVSLSRQS